MQTPTPAIAPVQFVPAMHAGVPAAAGQRCSTCSRRALCLPAGYAEPELRAMDALMFARRKVKAGESLYRQGENFRFVYAVHSGTFKSAAAVRDGREQVTGFHLAGDVLGLDALAEGRHASEASALEDSEVCAIPTASWRNCPPAAPTSGTRSRTAWVRRSWGSSAHCCCWRA